MTGTKSLPTEADSAENGLEILSKISDFESSGLLSVRKDSSRYMLKWILDAIPQPVFWKDQYYVYQGCNAAFSVKTGYSPQEIIGKTDFDLTDDETATRCRAEDQQVIENGRSLLDIETLHIDQSGQQKWDSVSRLPLRDFNGNIIGVLGTHRDITEQKLVQRSLSESDERLHIIFDCAPDAYFLLDQNGVFIDGNQEAEKLTGYHRLELFRQNFFEADILSKSEMAIMGRYLAEVSQNKVAGPYGLVLTRKDRSIVPVEMRSFMVTIQDLPMVLSIARDSSL